MVEKSGPPPHSMATRAVHAGLALAIATQLVTSLILRPDEGGDAGNFAFQMHEYSGLAAFGFVAAFWIVMTFRRRGTPMAMLFPWFRRDRLGLLWQDVLRHARALTHLRLPPANTHDPLASAVHGLGLALMSIMALSGTIYYFVNTGDPDAGGVVGVTMTLHRTFANIVWVYLIGHAGLAVIQHVANDHPLAAMWSTGGGTARPHPISTARLPE